MNKTSQQGSAHVVIIIILVGALLAALGFVFWQNFIQKQPSENPKQSTTHTDSQPDNAASREESLRLSESSLETRVPAEWGLKAEAMWGDGQKKNLVGYELSSTRLTSKASPEQACASSAGTIQIVATGAQWSDGKGTPITIDEYKGNDAKKIGDVYYVYVAPYRCEDLGSLDLSDADYALQRAFREMMTQDFIKNLRAS